MELNWFIKCVCLNIKDVDAAVNCLIEIIEKCHILILYKVFLRYGNFELNLFIKY